jgi:hypothetical protein
MDGELQWRINFNFIAGKGLTAHRKLCPFLTYLVAFVQWTLGEHNKLSQILLESVC